MIQIIVGKHECTKWSFNIFSNYISYKFQNFFSFCKVLYSPWIKWIYSCANFEWTLLSDDSRNSSRILKMIMDWSKAKIDSWIAYVYNIINDALQFLKFEWMLHKSFSINWRLKTVPRSYFFLWTWNNFEDNTLRFCLTVKLSTE